MHNKKINKYGLFFVFLKAEKAENLNPGCVYALTDPR